LSSAGGGGGGGGGGGSSDSSMAVLNWIIYVRMKQVNVMCKL
jgi:hypothetical protein